MEQDDAHHEAKMASTATSSPGLDAAETTPDTDVDMELDVEEADMTRWKEAEFEEKCTYIVKDTAWEAGPDGDVMTTTRAEASLPRNLVFKHPADGKEVRLKHTHTHTHSRTHTLHADIRRHTHTHTGRHANFLSGSFHTLRQRKPSAHTRESDAGHVMKRGSCLVVKHTHTHITERNLCVCEWVCETPEANFTHTL